MTNRKRIKRVSISYVIGMLLIAGLAFANPNQPQANVGLTWFTATDPTTSTGVSAPLWQFLVRTDSPSIYYKSGAANTSWTQIGAAGGGGGGGTVTSLACGAGVACSPSPITTSGTVSISTRFNIPGETINTETATELDNYDPWHAGPHTARVEVDPTQATLLITGIVAGADGDELLLWNGGNGGTNPNWITLPSQSSSSSALNRFWIANGKEVNIVNNDGLLLIYDGGFGWTAFGAATSIIRAQELSVDPTVAPTALTSGSTTNNYNPWTGTSTTSYVRQDVSGSGTATITGITAAGAPNSTGRVLFWNNISAAGSITFKSSNGGSTGPNQIIGPNNQDVTIGPDGSITFLYDTTEDAWRVLDSTIASALSGTGTANTLAMFTGTNTLGNSPISYDGSTTLSTTANFDAASFALGASAPSWTDGASAPTGACTNGSMYSVTASASPGFYVCASSAWVAVAGNAITGSLTSGDIPVASGTTTLANSSLRDNGTTVSTGEPFAALSVTDNGNRVFSTTGTGLQRDGTNAYQIDLNVAGASCAAGSFVTSISSTGTGTCTATGLTGLVTGDILVAASGSTIGVYGGASACSAGSFVTAISAAGATTCSAGGLSGTTNTIAKFTGTNSIGNSSITDNGTTITFGENTVQTGTETIQQTLATPISATITGTVNDWAPTGLATASTIYSTSSAGVPTITGLSGGAQGRRITIINDDPSNDLLIAANNAGSLAANRITGPWGTTNLDLPAGTHAAINMEYEGTSRWRITSFTSNVLPTLTATTTVQVGGTAGPTWSSGSGAPTGACVSGSMYSLTSSTTPAFYVCANSVWIAAATGGGSISGLTAGDVPVAASATSLTNGSMADDGTSVTVQGFKPTVCSVSSSTTIVNLTIPAGCSFAVWTPTTNAEIVGIAPPASGSRHVTIFVSSAGGGNFDIFSFNSNATATSWQFEGDLASGGGWLAVDSMFTIDYDTTNSKWITNLQTNIGTTVVNGSLNVTNGEVLQGSFGMLSSPGVIYNLNTTANTVVDAAGTGGAVKINSNDSGLTNAGTGGLLVYPGANSATPYLSALSSGITATTLYDTTQVFSASTNSNGYGYVSNLSGTFNTTAAVATVYGIFADVATSVSSGSFPLNDIAGYFTATNGTVNTAIEADAGNVILNHTSGFTQIGGAISSNQQYTYVDTQQLSSASGTYTPTANIRMVHVRMCGAGGGGGGAGGGAGRAVGGGGGGGAFVEFTLTASTFTGGAYANGTGGTGGSTSGGTGITGGDTTLVINSTTYTAKGATGGGGDTSGTVGTLPGGQPQTGSSLVPTTGSVGGWNGDNAVEYASGGGMAGNGGSAPFGVGGLGASSLTNGANAVGHCAGGGGAYASGTGTSGGGGAAGVIYIDESM
jgi:hypothetical protein